MICGMRNKIFFIYHSQLLIDIFVSGTSSTVSGDGIPGIKNLHIWSIVYQEYKYDWSEHMARDERFHPAIMVIIFMKINYIITIIYPFRLALNFTKFIFRFLQGTILVIFLVSQSFLIATMENLSYFDAFYACFITYMTIGFGDMDIFVSNINHFEDILSINNKCKSRC